MAAEWDEPVGVCEAGGTLLHDAGEAVDSIQKGEASGQAQGRGHSDRIFDEFAPGGSGLWGREGGEDLSGVRHPVSEGAAGDDIGGIMFGISSATKVFVACGATDLRKSFNGLYGLAEQKIRQDPLSGHAFVFCNRDRDRVKIFFWDGSGFWVCAKRLEKGRFSWPKEDAEPLHWDREMLMMVLGGMEMENVKRKPWYRR